VNHPRPELLAHGEGPRPASSGVLDGSESGGEGGVQASEDLENITFQPGSRLETHVVGRVAVLLPVGNGRGQGEVERRLDALLLRPFQDGQEKFEGGGLG
jgi:hypothetical protein